jgi:2-polyprenyl-3-methyl-5-hydroxy-6-metoxy-1,4-benzoquinol methylase
MATPDSHAQAEKFFDQIAEDYRKRSEGQVWNVSSLSFARRQELVTRLLNLTPEGGTLLDYGMGPAVFGPPAAARKLHYIGIDISQKMIDLAKAMNLPNAEYHLGDLSVLERFKGAADTVLLIGLIDYLEHPGEGLKALANCVKPGGRIILSFRNHRSIPRVLRNGAKATYRALKGEKKGADTAFAAPVLERSFVPGRDFVPLLREAGFTEFKTHYLDASPVFWNMPLPKWLWRLWKKTDAALAQPWLSFLCASGVLMASGKK